MKLYRGVNSKMFEDGKGLRPKGQRVAARSFHLHGYHGDSQRMGFVIENAALLHIRGRESADDPETRSNYVSFSKDRCVAERFALNRGALKGVIYETSVSLLSAHEASVMVMSEMFTRPLEPEDHEVLVRAVDGGDIPLAAIVRFVEVGG